MCSPRSRASIQSSSSVLRPGASGTAIDSAGGDPGRRQGLQLGAEFGGKAPDGLLRIGVRPVFIRTMKRQVSTVASATSTSRTAYSKATDDQREQEQRPIGDAARRDLGPGAADQARSPGRSSPIATSDHKAMRPRRGPPSRPRRYSRHSALPSTGPSQLRVPPTLGCHSQIAGVAAGRESAPPAASRRGPAAGAAASRVGLGGKYSGADYVGLLRAPAPGVVEEPGEQHDGQGSQELRRPGAGAAQGGKRFVQIGVAGLQRPAHQRQREHGHNKQLTWSTNRSHRRPCGRPARKSRTQRVPGYRKAQKKAAVRRREQNHAERADAARRAQLDHHAGGETEGRRLQHGNDDGRAVRAGRRSLPAAAGTIAAVEDHQRCAASMAGPGRPNTIITPSARNTTPARTA